MRGRLAFAVLAALTAAALFVRHAGRWLVVNDPLPAGADAIVVLAGSPADRALEAATLYRAGLAPRVVITRERPDRGTTALRARGVRLPEHDELLRQALEGLGVPADAIERLRRRTFSTESESATVARVACRRGWRRIIVVTSAAHSRRAGWIVRQTMGPGIAVTMRASRWDPFPAARWWHVRHAAKLVLGEYEKIVHFWAHERWTIAPCGGLRRRPA